MGCESSRTSDHRVPSPHAFRTAHLGARAEAGVTVEAVEAFFGARRAVVRDQHRTAWSRRRAAAAPLRRRHHARTAQTGVARANRRATHHTVIAFRRAHASLRDARAMVGRGHDADRFGRRPFPGETQPLSTTIGADVIAVRAAAPCLGAAAPTRLRRWAGTLTRAARSSAASALSAGAMSTRAAVSDDYVAAACRGEEPTQISELKLIRLMMV